MTSTLPDSIDQLKKIAQHYEAENNILREKIRLLQAKLFGRKTEKKLYGIENGQQVLLFNEAEEYNPPKEEEMIEEEVVEITVPAHSRKKPGRKPLPEDLPRVDVIHDISEEEKVCACGCMKDRIGEETSEQLEYIPAEIRVIRHIRPKYACKSCEGVEADEPAASIASLPPMIIPKSIATPSLLAHIMTSKFADATPFYRQENQLERIGIEIPRSSMCGWAIKAAYRCEPLMELLNKDIRSGPIISIDETTVQVMKEVGRSNTTKSYMWVFRGGEPDKPLLSYQYHPTRSGKEIMEYLKKYKGYIQTDGYGGYDFLDTIADITHVGCWAHARRNFVDVVKASGKRDSVKGRTGHAEDAVSYIQRLYAIEKDARERELPFDKVYELRQEKSKPVLVEFKSWLVNSLTRVNPQGLLGKAISYTLNQWDRLIKYINDGRIRIDNNLTENAIRPFVVGRKNWLFSGTPKGASASATLYSLIESAKANNLEPYRYLRFLFEKIPFASTEDDYKSLLPNRINRSLVAS